MDSTKALIDWSAIVDELIEDGLPEYHTADDCGLERTEYAEWFAKAFVLAQGEAAQPAAEGWRDISSAPKDGTKFLAVWGKRIAICRWGIGPYDRSQKKYLGGWSIGLERNAKPTHWMPLPASPNAASQDGGREQ